MKTIHVDTGRPYDVLIGNGLIEDCGKLIREKNAARKDAVKAAVISDDKVWELYGEKVTESLRSAGFETLKLVLPNGEESKNTDNLISVLEFLAENEFTRSDLIAALGGGVVGDLAGFAAAVMLRGVDFIQIPTTLLACVDSSVGGKTAVDLRAGKNLAGAFHQPRLVICDLDVLDSLPEETFKDGSAEVIKYGVLADLRLFEHLMDKGLEFDREYVVSRCIEIKRDVVNEDEFDTGKRRLLNLGHTLAHAAEQLSSYKLSHGKAVAIGMSVFSAAAASYGICDRLTAERIREAVKRFGLPCDTDYSAEELYEVMLRDKKRNGSSISIVLPEKIGRCIIKKMDIAELEDFIRAGL